MVTLKKKLELNVIRFYFDGIPKFELSYSGSRPSIYVLTLVNAGYFFEEITRGGAQTSAPPKIS